MPRDTHIEAPEVFTEVGKNPAVDLTKIDTLHELLGIALNDLEQLMDDPNYIVDMNNWHSTTNIDGVSYPDGLCHACLAGAVMAKTLQTHHRQDSVPGAFSSRIADRLGALDNLRSGFITAAYESLHGWGSDPPAALGLSEVWLPELRSIHNAVGNTKARFLLSKLRLMQADLKEAGL